MDDLQKSAQAKVSVSRGSRILTQKGEVVDGGETGEEVKFKAIAGWKEGRRQIPREALHLERDNILKHKISRNKLSKTLVGKI